MWVLYSSGHFLKKVSLGHYWDGYIETESLREATLFKTIGAAKAALTAIKAYPGKHKITSPEHYFPREVSVKVELL